MNEFTKIMIDYLVGRDELRHKISITKSFPSRSNLDVFLDDLYLDVLSAIDSYFEGDTKRLLAELVDIVSDKIDDQEIEKAAIEKIKEMREERMNR